MNMEVRALWAIRDARGLNYAEKAFLFVVASRGCMTAKWDTAAADMGMSKNTYYKTRDSLLGKGLIEAGTRFNSTTVYTVCLEQLLSLTGKEDSLTVNEFSPGGETKVTTKGTKKETDSAVADAPAPTLQEDEHKEEVTEKTEPVEATSLQSERTVAAFLDRETRIREHADAAQAELDEAYDNPTDQELERRALSKVERERYWQHRNKKRLSHEEAMAEIDRIREVEEEW